MLGTSAPEGSLGNGFADVVVTLSSPRTEPVSVTVTTSDGTAIAGEDYISLPPTVLTFAPGETTQAVSVPLISDRTFENDEFFKVHLSNPTVAVIFAGDAGVTITNDDPTPAVNVTNYFIEEGGPGNEAEVAVYFSLSNPSDFPIRFDMTTLDGTARADRGDYVPLSGTLEFAPGETAKTVNLTTFGDRIFERNETFTLNLSSPVNATIANGHSTITILDDDPTPTLMAAPLSVPEGDRGLAAHAVQLTLSNPSAFPASVSVSSLDGSAIGLADYFPFFDQLVTFAPGEMETTITVRVVGNTIDQFDRSFSIELAEAVELNIGTATQEITIVDDDPPEVFSDEFSYRDVDGDMVTVRTDRGAWSHEDYVLEPAGAMGGFRLAHLDFTSHSDEFAGANIRIKVDPALGGDGRASVGRIEALGVDLHSVKVSGPLGGISVGDSDPGTFGLRQLKVDSLGGSGEVSEFAGGAKRIAISGDVSDARLVASGEGAGFAKVKVGGNWNASDLAASANPGDDGFFGTPDDDLMVAKGNLISRISKIVIGGAVSGTDSPDDHFGIVAAQIGKFKADGAKQRLTATGREVIELSEDVTLRELA
ncbi:MAG: Calx-beta domain-containing protein [Chthoniobacteraceae bacterium]